MFTPARAAKRREAVKIIEVFREKEVNFLRKRSEVLRKRMNDAKSKGTVGCNAHLGHLTPIT
jgi:hypothetical protein